jgi:hypothetical protein
MVLLTVASIAGGCVLAAGFLIGLRRLHRHVTHRDWYRGEDAWWSWFTHLRGGVQFGIAFGLAGALLSLLVMIPPVLRPTRTWNDIIGVVVGLL